MLILNVLIITECLSDGDCSTAEKQFCIESIGLCGMLQGVKHMWWFGCHVYVLLNSFRHHENKSV